MFYVLQKPSGDFMLHTKPLREFYVTLEVSKKILCFISDLQGNSMLQRMPKGGSIFHRRALSVFHVL